MKRKEDLPLSVSSASWQRFNTATIDQQSSVSGSVSVSITRSNGYITNSEIGDSLSNASLPNTVENDDEDDETTSRIRESLKRELKLIQNAKKDLKIKKSQKYKRSLGRAGNASDT